VNKITRYEDLRIQGHRQQDMGLEKDVSSYLSFPTSHLLILKDGDVIPTNVYD
jgi:hypothetical protein